MPAELVARSRPSHVIDLPSPGASAARRARFGGAVLLATIILGGCDAGGGGTALPTSTASPTTSSPKPTRSPVRVTPTKRSPGAKTSPKKSPTGSSQPPTGRHQRTYRYRVGTKGDVHSNLGAFTRTVAAALGDDRGWSLSGRILFRRVGAGERHDLRVWLAEPEQVDAAAPVCSARYSCRVGNDVYINDDRFRLGAETYADRPLYDYQRYVVLHEVGHWLGLGHDSCPGKGKLAPVMQQQSISLDGCRSNVWPLPEERKTVRRRHL